MIEVRRFLLQLILYGKIPLIVSMLRVLKLLLLQLNQILTVQLSKLSVSRELF